MITPIDELVAELEDNLDICCQCHNKCLKNKSVLYYFMSKPAFIFTECQDCHNRNLKRYNRVLFRTADGVLNNGKRVKG
jgi:hypothetical protein